MKLYDYIFLLLLAAALFVRISYFDWPLGEGGADSSRDYIIASKILNDKARPGFGPDSGFGTYNSPSYYYLLAFFLWIRNDFIFLQYVNILLQTAVILLLYALTRSAFGQPAALLTTGLFAFSEPIIRQSLHVWQPYVMQFFFYLAILFLLLAYRKQNYRYLLSSLVMIIVAGSLHLSAFAMFPLIFIANLFLLKSWKASLDHYIGIVAAAGSSFLLLFGTIFSSIGFSRPAIKTNISEVLWHLPFWQKLISEFYSLLTLPFKMILFSFGNSRHDNLDIKYLVILGVLICGYCFFQKSREKRMILMTVLGLLIQPAFWLSVATASSPEIGLNIQSHHFTPVFGLLFILAIVPIADMLSQNRFATMIAIILLFSQIVWPGMISAQAWASNPKHKQNYQHLAQAAHAIEEKVNELHTEQHLENFRFFQLTVYRSGSNLVSDMLFWNVLEQDMKYPFVYITQRGEHIINDDQYIFLVCLEHQDIPYPAKQCLQDFREAKHIQNVNDRSNYAVLDKIYSESPFTIFLTKKTSISGP